MAHDCADLRRRFGLCPVCEAEAGGGPVQAPLELGEVPCAFGCGQPVNPMDPRTWQQQFGWTRPRQQGGTNALSLRQPVPGRYAHSECIDAAKAGRLAQPALPITDEEF